MQSNALSKSAKHSIQFIYEQAQKPAKATVDKSAEQLKENMYIQGYASTLEYSFHRPRMSSVAVNTAPSCG